MLLGLIELAGNRALEFDPETSEKLQKLHGKTVAIDIRNAPQTLYFTPETEGIELSTNIDGEPDVTIKANVRTLVKIGRDGIDDADLEPSELEIAGDAIVGQRFASILGALQIDWEELLAQQFGDSPARLMTQTAGKLSEISQDIRNVMQQNLNKLINEELEITASKQEVDDFLDAVDTLRADTDQLTARLKRLQP